MGTISIDNTVIEKRLAVIEEATLQANSISVSNLNAMRESLKVPFLQLKLLTARVEECFNTGIDESDIRRE